MRIHGFVFGVVGFLVLLAPRVHATTYYVSPSGSDGGNDGSMASPFASMGHAQSVARPGDVFDFRAGTYPYTAATEGCSSTSATINAVVLDVSGAQGSPITYEAFPGETPIFDFSGIKDSCRITGIRITASFIRLKGLEIEGVPQNNDLNHESWGVWNSGSNNVFERLNLHDNMGPGLFIQDGANNLVLNCDSHDNYDPLSSTGPGTNADGFGCHIGSNGTGNVFRGCRSWFNSDDGYDLIQAQVPVLIENSWAFNNGYRSGTTTASGGDGNGFKGGGYGIPPTHVPAKPPQHTIRNCVAFQNRSAGFYANHEPVGDFWYNDTSFDNNSANFNMLGYANGAAVNVGTLRNDIAYTRTLIANGTGGQIDDQFNSWDTSLGLTVSDADFLSTSTTGWDGPRAADGSLPVLTSLHLQPTSGLVDRGTNVGLPFNGAAPDLGAFETGPPLVDTDAGSAGAGGASSTGGAGGLTGNGGASGSGNTPGSGGNSGNSGAGGLATSAGGDMSSAGAGNGGSVGLGGATANGGSVGASGASGAENGAGGSENGVGGNDDANGDGATKSGCSCNLAARSHGTSSVVVLGLAWLVRRRRRGSRRVVA
jgi:uncharacterized protein (TIGR03382 family)